MPSAQCAYEEDVGPLERLEHRVFVPDADGDLAQLDPEI